MAKKNGSVPVQKGPINCAMPTMKTISPQQMAKDDYDMRVARLDGQTLKFHTPKK